MPLGYRAGAPCSEIPQGSKHIPERAGICKAKPLAASAVPTIARVNAKGQCG